MSSVRKSFQQSSLGSPVEKTPAASKTKVNSVSKPEPLDVWARRELTSMEQETVQALADLASQDVVERASPDQLDAAAEQEHREAVVRLGNRLKIKLVEIQKALKKLDDDEYGICEVSGDEIPEARLRANPLARYTIEVQERIEHRARQGV